MCRLLNFSLPVIHNDCRPTIIIWPMTHTYRRPPSLLPGQAAGLWWRPAGLAAKLSAGAESSVHIESRQQFSLTLLHGWAGGTVLSCKTQSFLFCYDGTAHTDLINTSIQPKTIMQEYISFSTPKKVFTESTYTVYHYKMAETAFFTFSLMVKKMPKLCCF